MQEHLFFFCNFLRRKHKRQREEESIRTKKRVRQSQDRMFMTLVASLFFMMTFEYGYVAHVARPLIPDYRFNLENLGTEFTGGLEAEHLFRFSSEQLYYLTDALRIPWIMMTPERDKYHAIEGLCIVLRRLVFPVRYVDMVQLFGRSTAPMSRINHHMLAWLYARWKHLFDFDAARVINYDHCSFKL